MRLIIEIREHFYNLDNRRGYRKFSNPELNAWSDIGIKNYGVFIPYNGDIHVDEKFTNVKIYSDIAIVNGEEIQVLRLTSNLKSASNEFAAICWQFIELGEKSENRMALQTNPHSWIEKWKSLLGDTIRKKTVYDVLSELLALESVLKDHNDVYWSGPDRGIRDIETSSILIDVKSSSVRYETTVTISSQYQLETDRDLYIYFCRVEKSTVGESIESVMSRIKSSGKNVEDLESKLDTMGYGSGKLERAQTYNILERSRYHVNDAFPKITASSFKLGKLPDFITKIEYTVNLDSLSSEVW